MEQEEAPEEEVAGSAYNRFSVKNEQAFSGAGTAGTSYSGGSGGGGTTLRYDSAKTLTGVDASPNGGSGGVGTSLSCYLPTNHFASGGARKSGCIWRNRI